VDAEVKKFLAEKFVPVWVDDKQDDKFAAKLGLPNEGYPNVAVYDGAGEYLGRVIGFGGKDPWFANVKEVWKVGEVLGEAREAARKDPAKWALYATAVGEIPGREKDALDALEKVPAAKRGKDFAATKASFAARAAWAATDRDAKAALQGVKSPDDMKKAAPKALALVESWLQEHAGKNPKTDPTALARKGFFLVVLEKKAEAAEIAAKILKDFPDSKEALSILRALR
jgi:hypothetical protein